MLEVYFAGEVQLKEFDDLIEKYDLKEIIFKFNPDSMPSFYMSVITYPLIFVLS